MTSELFPHQITLQDVQLRDFKHGIRIQPEKQLFFRSGAREGTPLADITAAEAAPLIFKDVAIYDFVLGGSPERENLYNTLWNAWLPYRDQRLTLEEPRREKPTKADVQTQMRGWLAASFKPMSQHTSDEWDAEVRIQFKTQEPNGPEEAIISPQALHWLLAWHESLCGRVGELVGTESGRETVPQDLNPTFKKVIVVLDQSDWQNGGCLVCCPEDTAEAFGLKLEGKQDVVQGTVTWGTWRLSVEAAIQKIAREAAHARSQKVL